jgi:hypothetical protein
MKRMGDYIMKRILQEKRGFGDANPPIVRIHWLPAHEEELTDYLMLSRRLNLTGLLSATSAFLYGVASEKKGDRSPICC